MVSISARTRRTHIHREVRAACERAKSTHESGKSGRVIVAVGEVLL